jgi:hypothetical protein
MLLALLVLSALVALVAVVAVMISIMLRRPQKSPGPSASPEASRSVATRTEIGPAGPRMPVVETDGAAITELERTFAM